MATERGVLHGQEKVYSGADRVDAAGLVVEQGDL
jgi:hypothetical protein